MPNAPAILHALTRAPSASLDRCELTYKSREPIDVARAREQHAAYEQALGELGVLVHRLPPADDLPDAVFVEDVAVVLDELAIGARPGAESRRSEVDTVVDALARWRRVHRLAAPATLDGGDVVRVDRTLYVGRSSRTNEDGIAQLRALAAPHGYTVIAVDVAGALHLKTACTYAGRRTVLANPEWADLAAFHPLQILPVPVEEPWGASVLEVRGRLLVPAAFPGTRALLARRGFDVIAVDLSELQKAEGGPTCLSIVFPERRAS